MYQISAHSSPDVLCLPECLIFLPAVWPWQIQIPPCPLWRLHIPVVGILLKLLTHCTGHRKKDGRKDGWIAASSSDSCCLSSPELYWPLAASLWCKGTQILLFPGTLWYFWCNYLLIYSLLDFPLNVLQYFKRFIQCFQIFMLSP